MVDYKDYEGETEQAALEAAAADLGASVSDLEYSLIDEGAEGVFGLGARPAVVRVTLRAEGEGEAGVEDEGSEALEKSRPRRTGPDPERAEQARKTTVELLELMGFDDVRVEVSDEEEQIVVKVRDAEGSSSLDEIFKASRPPVASALQFIVNKVVNRFPEDRKHIVLDAPSPTRRAAPAPRSSGSENDDEFDAELVAMAQLLAERARETNQVLSIYPMLAGDRRAVHQTIMKIEGVSTVSTGDGVYRKLHIIPAALQGKRNRGRARRPAGD